MLSSELVSFVNKQTGLSLWQSKRVLNSVLYTIKKQLKENSSVTIEGFGTFTTKTVLGYNSSAGFKLYLHPRRKIVFIQDPDIFFSVYNET